MPDSQKWVLKPCVERPGASYCHAANRQEGKQRYRCQNENCPYRTFTLNPTYPGRTREVKQQIVEMTLNGSGMRDIARVLHVNPTTVIQELKKTR